MTLFELQGLYLMLWVNDQEAWWIAKLWIHAVYHLTVSLFTGKILQENTKVLS